VSRRPPRDRATAYCNIGLSPAGRRLTPESLSSTELALSRRSIRRAVACSGHRHLHADRTTGWKPMLQYAVAWSRGVVETPSGHPRDIARHSAEQRGTGLVTASGRKIVYKAQGFRPHLSPRVPLFSRKEKDSHGVHGAADRDRASDWRISGLWLARYRYLPNRAPRRHWDASFVLDFCGGGKRADCQPRSKIENENEHDWGTERSARGRSDVAPPPIVLVLVSFSIP
jgi:hypothetical protein